MPKVKLCINRESGCQGVAEHPYALCESCREAARLLQQVIEIEDEQRRVREEKKDNRED